MFKGTIKITGATTEDLLDAIDEARRMVEHGNTSGFNSNDEGSVTLNITK
jgi:hypothetical protein